MLHKGPQSAGERCHLPVVFMQIQWVHQRLEIMEMGLGMDPWTPSLEGAHNAHTVL